MTTEPSRSRTTDGPSALAPGAMSVAMVVNGPSAAGAEATASVLLTSSLNTAKYAPSAAEYGAIEASMTDGPSGGGGSSGLASANLMKSVVVV